MKTKRESSEDVPKPLVLTTPKITFKQAFLNRLQEICILNMQEFNKIPEEKVVKEKKPKFTKDEIEQAYAIMNREIGGTYAASIYRALSVLFHAPELMEYAKEKRSGGFSDSDKFTKHYYNPITIVVGMADHDAVVPGMFYIVINGKSQQMLTNDGNEYNYNTDRKQNVRIATEAEIKLFFESMITANHWKYFRTHDLFSSIMDEVFSGTGEVEQKVADTLKLAIKASNESGEAEILDDIIDNE